MKATPYFQRTLFYDRSPAASEHYERCSGQIFESDPSATRIGVCFQICRNAPEYGEAKDTTKSHADKGSNGVLKHHQEISIHERLGSSDDDADNSSILSVASSTALPIAMDQRQADSGPPLYPGLPKLVSSEFGSGEIESFVERTKHEFRVFYLRQRHSLSHLQITKADFETLVRSCHVFPRFSEYVTGFGKKGVESEVGPPPLKFRDLYTTGDSVYRGFGKFASSNIYSCKILMFIECRVYLHSTVHRTYQSGPLQGSMVAATVRRVSSLQVGRYSVFHMDSRGSITTD